MIAYNPKDWFTFIFRLHKADTIRQLFPMMLLMGIYSLAVAYLELDILQLTDKSQLKNLTLIHSLLGFVLSMLLVFRTNTAYDRWWEGRRLWGSLVNSSRNLALKLDTLLPDNATQHRTFFAESIALFAQVLAKTLGKESTRLALSELTNTELLKISTEKHPPSQVASIILKRTLRLQKENILTQEQLLFLQPELTNFMDVCGGCERIKNTPIPFSYSIFIKKFIFFYVMTMPIGYVFSLSYGVVPLVIFVFYVLVSLELLAEEIEDPFSNDVNDIPTEKIATNITKSVADILKP